ncbi:MAG: ABC transporter substrate-binding protein/permease [Eubacterium sp.]|nr:ABC transporter substrate-binding protein/permease [Eubacterium sp.]
MKKEKHSISRRGIIPPEKKVMSVFILLLVFMILCHTAPVSYAAASKPEYDSLSDLQGKTVAMLTGAPFEELITSKVGEVKEFQYFSSITDMELALKTGKIDAFMMNNAAGEYAANMDPELALMEEPLGLTSFGFAFEKGSTEIEKWQKAYDQIPDEEKDELWVKWTGSDESKKILPEQDWPGEEGTVKAAVCDTLPPMSYALGDGKLTGFDIEMILKMAKILDVHVEFTGMEFSSIMPEVQSGKALLAAGSIVINDERKKAVDFIDYYPAKFVLEVRSAGGDTGGSKGFWGELYESFSKTFLTDGRYQMVLTGLFDTVFISISAGILGVLLAFALVFLRHKNNRVCNRIINIYTALIAGIPAVVILMVLYYIVFNTINLSPIPVAIIGFMLIFGARAYSVIWNAVEAVDPGQREAALALGYSENKAFRQIILPQSRSMYFSLLQTQFITMVKETSIAGYITVLELTRAGDLIRSRTMEAFFPLIAIAVFYFVLTRIFVQIIKLIYKLLGRRRDSRKIKGVDL